VPSFLVQLDVFDRTAQGLGELCSYLSGLSVRATREEICGAYIVICEQFGPEHAVVAIMRLLVGKGLESDCSYFVGTDERDPSVSAGSKDLV
jgi:hypothetical protein